MYKIKKITALVLVIAITMSLLATACFGTEVFSLQDNIIQESLVNSKWTTTEVEMPKLETNDYKQATSHNTILTPERAAWVEHTTRALSDAYSQDVSKIEETSDLIIFEFEQPFDTNIYEEHVLKVEYVKPEARSTTNYETKFVYLWGWSSDYLYLDSAEGTCSTLKDISITVTGLSKRLSGYVFAYSIIGSMVDLLNGPDTVELESFSKCYFLNKLVYVKSNTHGLWVPYAQAGIRKDFTVRNFISIDRYGQPNIEDTYEKNGTPSSNPQNYDNMLVSNHYNNNDWLIDKAIEAFEADTPYNESYGSPSINGTHIGEAEP